MDLTKNKELQRKSLFLYDVAITNQEKTISNVKKGKVKYAEVSDKVLLSLMRWELTNLKENRERVKREIEYSENLSSKTNQNTEKAEDKPNKGNREGSLEPNEITPNKDVDKKQNATEVFAVSTNKTSSVEAKDREEYQTNNTGGSSPPRLDNSIEQQSFLVNSFDVAAAAETSEKTAEPPLDPILSLASTEKNDDSNSEKKPEPESSSKSPQENSPPPEPLSFDLNQNSDEFQLDYWT